MPGVTVQFHMLPDELTDFVADAVRRHSLAVELERFFPPAVRHVAPGADLAREVRRASPVDCIWLLYRPPRCRNHERFGLHVGRVRGDRLEQSHLGGGTENAAALRVLRGLARQLKQRTRAGVWVVGEAGHAGFNKLFRVSPGRPPRTAGANSG